MNYKLIKNYQDTWYYEFCPGKYDSKDPKYDSVYIDSGAMDLIDDCLHRANNNYVFFQYETVYTKEKGQMQLLAEELKIRLTEIIEDKDLSKRFDNIFDNTPIVNDLKKYKTEIVTMIEDLIDWLENLKEDELTIIPPVDKFFDMVLRPE